jgi:signal transduction histidine kinase/ActR/RegA family two-component response regulator
LPRSLLILAPKGRDSEVTRRVLHGLAPDCEVCPDLASLAAALSDDAGAAIITEEELRGPDLEALTAWCGRQPPWSDLPIIVLATKRMGRRPRDAAETLDRLGNVILLERPFNVETLVSAVKSALRGRRRQFESRSLLLAQADATRSLEVLNETLEGRVTERTHQLEDARDTLSIALEAAGMGTWILDARTKSSKRSSQHDRIFGYEALRAEWSLDTFLAHVVDGDRLAALNAFEAAAETGELDLQCRIRRVDGLERWIVAKGRVDFDPDRRPVRINGIVMDVTERRQTEEALHQAQKMEAIGQLTGGVAHDFNNLLTVIVGGLDMIIRRPERTERVVQIAEAAMTAARRGEQLTRQLLAFSRRQMLRPQTLDPNRLLANFEDLARRAVGEAVTLRFDFDPAAQAIHVDPAQFEAAMLNLIVNARDALDNRGAITIATRNSRFRSRNPTLRTLKPGHYVIISVQDAGSGMDPATLSRVFEPFFTTKEVGKGSGLGLAQVYGFTRSAGGDVGIESAPGEGTTVSLYLPRSLETMSEEEPAPDRQAPLQKAAEGERILLVEDDEAVLRMACDSLQELNYDVLVARNANQALGHLRGEERIDLMFSDVVMPGGMDGVQLAGEAKRIRPELKILLASGYVGNLGSSQTLSEELVVLNKPYRRDELAAKLREVMAASVTAKPTGA